MPSIRNMAKDATMQAAETLCKDTSYIPDEMLDWSPMDFGKSANTILAECAKVNLSIADAIRGAVPRQAELDFQSLKSCVVDSAKEVCNAIDSLSDSDLEGDMQMPWGMIFPTTQAILLPVSHMTYHDGQINYIQLLLGDTKFHWAEK